mmetsp:Transcript_5520/g.18563  ORF Transcript_5520/g.18563 Transcript_5520/m.18563 type:complete len:90 (+) Transcript_5520:7-276(+)
MASEGAVRDGGALGANGRDGDGGGDDDDDVARENHHHHRHHRSRSKMPENFRAARVFVAAVLKISAPTKTSSAPSSPLAHPCPPQSAPP